MFGGRQVLRADGGNVIFNTDLIMLETVYIDRTNTTDFSHKSNMGIPSATVITQPHNDNYVAIVSPMNDGGNSNNANPLHHHHHGHNNSQKQTMIVTVPPNAGPGSVLTVSAPNGSVLSVLDIILLLFILSYFFSFFFPVLLHV
jgi:hypothetical protein